jgi:hypothetical protein
VDEAIEAERLWDMVRWMVARREGGKREKGRRKAKRGGTGRRRKRR